MQVAAWSGSLLAWEDELTAFKSRLNQAFGRAELRRSARPSSTACCQVWHARQGWQLADKLAWTALSAAILAGPQFLAGG